MNLLSFTTIDWQEGEVFHVTVKKVVAGCTPTRNRSGDIMCLR
jgi:hypothetical protein